MFAHGPLTRCLKHKAALLQHSAGHRRALVAEAKSLRPVAARVDLGITAVRRARGSWVFLAPLLSLWRKRKEGPSGFVHHFVNIASLAGSLMTLWKTAR